MRIALPLTNGKLAMHFGHCERFAFVDVDLDTGVVVAEEVVTAPDHEPGLLPRWVAAKGAGIIITGGMGSRAEELFAQNGIRVVAGAPCEKPDVLVAQYLAGSLAVGENTCDH